MMRKGNPFKNCCAVFVTLLQMMRKGEPLQELLLFVTVVGLFVLYGTVSTRWVAVLTGL